MSWINDIFGNSNSKSVKDASLNALAGLSGLTKDASGKWTYDSSYSPYTSAESQSMINSAFNKQADTISSASKNKAAKLMELGYSADQANSLAKDWASDQAMKSRLDSEAGFAENSVGTSYDRLSNLLSLINSGKSNSSSSSSGWDDLSTIAGIAAKVGLFS